MTARQRPACQAGDTFLHLGRPADMAFARYAAACHPNSRRWPAAPNAPPAPVRSEPGEFSAASHHHAAQAQAGGLLAGKITPVPVTGEGPCTG